MPARPLHRSARAATLIGGVALAVVLGSVSPAAAVAPSLPGPMVEPTPADREAGILDRTVATSDTGELDVVTGSTLAPGPGAVRTVRVEVERGLPVDRDRFATFVLATLNDDRGWGHGGAMTFARTDGAAALSVVLASPDTSARLCLPLETLGTQSCRIESRAILTFHRWVNGTDDYTGDPTGYRQYLVNHEVGHVLGHGHESCPGPGRPAPVMQQQTLGLQGCEPNPWPHP